jgi:lipid-binding SYLF domain-containing protein
MKQVLVLSSVLLLAFAVSAAASLSSSEQKRLSDAATAVREFKAVPDRAIPENLWSRADCVTVIPNLKKAAFIIGGEYGKGVMSCRSGQAWSAPIFVELEKGSAGLQIGAQQADVVLLMMNRDGVDKLLSDKVNLGADASVAAGPVGRTASAGTDAQLSAGILAYSRAQGAFAGINLSGGVLRPDKSANEAGYGTSVTVRDVLFKSDVPVPVPAQAFVRALADESRATTGRK